MKNRTYDGPSMPLSIELDKQKYRQDDESYDDKVRRLAGSMSDNEDHKYELQEIFGEMRFLPAGRVQSAMGSRRITTAYNCFVSGEIEDSMDAIMERAANAAETMRRGGGIGYDFSRIRPRGDLIKSLDSRSSGPISFMGIFDAVCQTIASSGHRRGAQMGVLRVDHPDIGEFIRAKRNSSSLTGFNISVGITDAFMQALSEDDDSFELTFEGKVYDTISARELWEEIMSSTWDWAEPGVLFIDRISELNNLWYCEEIAATNPCGEQPLPPNGACLLGSFNLTKYVIALGSLDPEADKRIIEEHGRWGFDFRQFKRDIPHVVRAMDNVIDRTVYPLKAQEDEAKDKRRMGLGVTGLANAGEMIGHEYGSPEFLTWAEKVFACLRDHCYRASARLASEKGAFPLYHKDYLKSNFIKTLPASIKQEIRKNGIRNSHLTSIAPTGTISLVADNVSGGIEPCFSHYYDRTVQSFDGSRVERVEDYAFAHGTKGRTANELTVDEHLSVLSLAQGYVDSACSKTINVGDEVTYAEFKDIYKNAWEQGVKGCTTFRLSGKRYGILQTVEEEEETTSKAQEVLEQSGQTEMEEATACYFDPVTGQRECS